MGVKSIQIKRILSRRYKLWIAGFVLLYLAFSFWILCRLMQLRDYADIVSLSYPAEGVPETVFDQWRENAGSEIFSKAAVWKACGESAVTVENTGHEQKVPCYQVKGQPEAIFGKELISGRYFTEGEEGVCLLDMGTVRQLFGSENVLELTVRMGESTFRIVGMIKESTPICVIPAKKDTVFDGIAVRKKEAGQSANQAVSLLEAVFGSTDGQRVDGQLYSVTAWFLYGCIMASVLILTGSLARKGKGIFWLHLAVAVGILLIVVKIAEPGSDYLPSYWSDFEFFGQLFKEKAEQIQTLAIHQEFFVWQEMMRAWRRILAAEVLCGVCAAAVFTPKNIY